MAAIPLDLHVTTTASYTVVEVGGEIDFARAPKLRDCLRQLIDAGSRQLVVDLRQVDFMDSVGLGVLVGALRRLRGHDHQAGSLQLVCVEGLVVRILRLTGLDRVFPLHATLADALGGDSGLADGQSSQSEDRSEPGPQAQP
jgi:anti-sigma B factor antagonist